MIDAAQSYVARGWCVFPAPIGEKKSLMSAKNDRLGRKWGATCEPDDVVNYWNKWPNANVAVVTGPQSGIWVLDIDTPEGHARDGFASLAALVAEHGPLPETLTAESPSGSRHLYFNWPSAGGIRNTTNVPGPGLDVRAEGGMVIAPPSVKPDGGRYIWVNASPVADAPQWLLDLVTPDAPQMPAPRRATPPALGEVEELLTYIDPNAGGYKHWQTILSAIHDAFGGSDDGMHLADKWSERGANHKPGEVQDKWPSFTSGKGGGSGMGPIGYHAKQAGADVAGIGARHRLLNMPGPSHVPAGMMPDVPGQGMPTAPRTDSVVDLICARIKDNPLTAVELLADEVARLLPADREKVLEFCHEYRIKVKMQAAVKRAVTAFLAAKGAVALQTPEYAELSYYFIVRNEDGQAVAVDARGGMQPQTRTQFRDAMAQLPPIMIEDKVTGNARAKLAADYWWEHPDTLSYHATGYNPLEGVELYDDKGRKIRNVYEPGHTAPAAPVGPGS